MPIMLKQLHQPDFEALLKAVEEENIRRQAEHISLTWADLQLLDRYGVGAVYSALRRRPSYLSFSSQVLTQAIKNYHQYMA